MKEFHGYRSLDAEFVCYISQADSLNPDAEVDLFFDFTNNGSLSLRGRSLELCRAKIRVSEVLDIASASSLAEMKTLVSKTDSEIQWFDSDMFRSLKFFRTFEFGSASSLAPKGEIDLVKLTSFFEQNESELSLAGNPKIAANKPVAFNRHYVEITFPETDNIAVILVFLRNLENYISTI